MPVTVAEAEGRKGKSADEPAHTREVKLGCVFTQTTVDGDGGPTREGERVHHAAGSAGAMTRWDASSLGLAIQASTLARQAR